MIHIDLGKSGTIIILRPEAGHPEWTIHLSPEAARSAAARLILMAERAEANGDDRLTLPGLTTNHYP
jgi:hypothetical protein